MAVTEKEFFTTLGPGDQLRYRIKKDGGQVVDFVVQHETRVGDDYRPVVRYDGSHGRGHRDILDPTGETIDKHWLPDYMNLKDCLGYAASDLRDNWERYRDRFLERIG